MLYFYIRIGSNRSACNSKHYDILQSHHNGVQAACRIGLL
jgi:hypothetical protein